MQDLDAEGQKKWLQIPYDDRIQIAEFIFNEITRSQCSFRRLIYDRLGFECDAYCPLYLAGGMTITNSVSDYLDYEINADIEKGLIEEKASP